MPCAPLEAAAPTPCGGAERSLFPPLNALQTRYLPVSFPRVPGHATIAPDNAPGHTAAMLCWHDTHRQRVEDGMRGSPRADYCPPPTPGPALLWCFAASLLAGGEFPQENTHMGLRIVQVDAFTDTPFAGNPAAVCVLPAPREDQW